VAILLNLVKSKAFSTSVEMSAWCGTRLTYTTNVIISFRFLNKKHGRRVSTGVVFVDMVGMVLLVYK